MTRKTYVGPVPEHPAGPPEAERQQASRELADALRRDMTETGQPARGLAADKGQTWTTEELQRDFLVIGFSAQFVVVRRLSYGQVDTLEFTHRPRVYFGWQEEGSR